MGLKVQELHVEVSLLALGETWRARTSHRASDKDSTGFYRHETPTYLVCFCCFKFGICKAPSSGFEM